MVLQENVDSFGKAATKSNLKVGGNKLLFGLKLE